MTNRVIIFALAAFCLLMAACEKSKDFVADNTTPTATGYRPVSTNTLQDLSGSTRRNLGTTAAAATTFPAGATFNTELQFFSESPVKEINLYNTIGAGSKTKVATYPYKSAFSESKRADTLLVPYTMPTAASGTTIRLDYEIVNVNTLSLTRTAYVKVQ